VLPSVSRSICVPTKLTPLGSSVREYLFSKATSS
jgi:hypothetical protein